VVAMPDITGPKYHIFAIANSVAAFYGQQKEFGTIPSSRWTLLRDLGSFRERCSGPWSL
jgi:hypothetical protein